MGTICSLALSVLFVAARNLNARKNRRVKTLAWASNRLRSHLTLTANRIFRSIHVCVSIRRSKRTNERTKFGWKKQKKRRERETKKATCWLAAVSLLCWPLMLLSELSWVVVVVNSRALRSNCFAPNLAARAKTTRSFCPWRATNNQQPSKQLAYKQSKRKSNHKTAMSWTNNQPTKKEQLTNQTQTKTKRFLFFSLCRSLFPLAISSRPMKQWLHQLCVCALWTHTHIYTDVPTVSVVQREYSIVEGSPLSISCQVDSNPPPNIVNWRLVSDGKLTTNTNNEQKSLDWKQKIGLAVNEKTHTQRAHKV